MKERRPYPPRPDPMINSVKENRMNDSKKEYVGCGLALAGAVVILTLFAIVYGIEAMLIVAAVLIGVMLMLVGAMYLLF